MNISELRVNSCELSAYNSMYSVNKLKLTLPYKDRLIKTPEKVLIAKYSLNLKLLSWKSVAQNYLRINS